MKQVDTVIGCDGVVIIPTYNERENVENIIRAVFALEKIFHILIIDDGSPDGTAEIVKRLKDEFPERLHLMDLHCVHKFVIYHENTCPDLCKT